MSNKMVISEHGLEGVVKGQCLIQTEHLGQGNKSGKTLKCLRNWKKAGVTVADYEKQDGMR